MGGEIIKPKRRHFLSKKEVKILESSIKGSWISEIVGTLRSKSVESAVFDNFEIYIANGVPILAKAKKDIFPLLSFLLSLRNVETFPTIIVDRGASLALARGADLMAPGIRKISHKFELGEIIVAIDEEIKKPVAVLRSLSSSNKIEELIESKGKGKVAKNLHRPNDRIWRAVKYL